MNAPVSELRYDEWLQSLPCPQSAQSAQSVPGGPGIPTLQGVGDSASRLREPEWPGDPEPDELAWQSRWFAGDFGRNFRTTNGEEVEIVDFGWWNHGAGPDFRECVISLAGQIRKGSIELDRDARDWEHHGHSTNPWYRDTVLHLQLGERPGPEWFTRTDDHRLVPQVRLDLTTAQPGPAISFSASATPGRCLEAFRRLPREEILKVLEAAARHRLEKKGKQLQRTAAVHGRDQMLFQAMAEGLGYSRNRLPLKVLAQRLPLRLLLQRPDDSEALLFGVSGFLTGKAFDHGDAATKQWLRQLWDQWWRYRDTYAPGLPRVPIRWVEAGCRPLNHPQRRVAALHQLIKGWTRLRKLMQPATFSAKALRSFAGELHHPYWDVHYTLRSTAAPRRLALLGASRINDLLANICYPLLVPEEPRLWSEYCKLAAPDGNDKTRRAAVRLFTDHPERVAMTGKVWQQQALLQIYEDFCLSDQSGCASCPMPEQAISRRLPEGE